MTTKKKEVEVPMPLESMRGLAEKLIIPRLSVLMITRPPVL